jgi:predicted nucleic-acid-binding protein
MIGIDTNILLRVFVDESQRQSGRAYDVHFR